MKLVNKRIFTKGEVVPSNPIIGLVYGPSMAFFGVDCEMLVYQPDSAEPLCLEGCFIEVYPLNSMPDNATLIQVFGLHLPDWLKAESRTWGYISSEPRKHSAG